MKKRIIDYLQLSLQGVGIASLGTMNILEPKIEILALGGSSILLGPIMAAFNK